MTPRLSTLLARETQAHSRFVWAEIALEVATREALRRYRARHRVTYRELAREIGVTVGHLQNVQSGTAHSPKVAQWLANREGRRDA